MNLTEVLYDNLMESGSLELSEMTLKRKAECEELREEIFRHGVKRPNKRWWLM